MAKFYKLILDIYMEGVWDLGKLQGEGDGVWNYWKYSKPHPVDNPSSTLYVDVERKGVPADVYNSTPDAYIISERAAKVFTNHDVQLVPLQIRGQIVSENFYVMVITNEQDCLNENLSNFQKFEPGNSIRPDKVGQYKSITRFVIDSDRTGGRKIFRLKNHISAVIVAEEIKNEWEKLGLTGAIFLPAN